MFQNCTLKTYMVYFFFFPSCEQCSDCLHRSTNLYPITLTWLVHSAKSKGLPHGFWMQEWNLSIEKKIALEQNLAALRLQLSFLISEFFLLILFTIKAGFASLTIIINRAWEGILLLCITQHCCPGTVSEVLFTF